MTKKKSATIQIDNNTLELPVIVGSENEAGIDISQLRAKTGAVTVDNGFANTSSCESKITFLDGEKGILRYRGYPIEQLAKNASFLETSYLLINGNLPNDEELYDFEVSVKKCSLLPDEIITLIKSYPKDAHPMAMLSSVTCALSGIYTNTLDPKNADQVKEATIRLMGAMPTIAAYCYRHTNSLQLAYPNSHIDYCANFYKLMFTGPDAESEIKPEVIEALNLLLILHADHEQNCSTSTVRLVGSSEANLYASIAAGITALWGPLHGGANQAVMEMLQEIHQNGGDVQKYVELAKDKTSGFKLMGFGHRVYKNFDPRASIIKEACDKVLASLGIDNPLLKIAKELEEHALNDEYFKSKKLYPNVDFYSGIIYSALNIPVNMFTPMFVLGRLPGWIAHWQEMNQNPKARIGRPRQIYTGETERDYPIQNAYTADKKAA